MLSGNTWTEEDEARLEKAKAFFSPLEGLLNRFASECNVRAEPYPKSQPQWNFRFRTPQNRTGLIAMWEKDRGFHLVASHYDWMTADLHSGWYHLPETTYPNAEPETVWQGLTDKVSAILAGDGAYKPEPFPRNVDPDRIEGRRLATLDLPTGRSSQRTSASPPGFPGLR